MSLVDTPSVDLNFGVSSAPRAAPMTAYSDTNMPTETRALIQDLWAELKSMNAMISQLQTQNTMLLSLLQAQMAKPTVPATFPILKQNISKYSVQNLPKKEGSVKTPTYADKVKKLPPPVPAKKHTPPVPNKSKVPKERVVRTLQESLGQSEYSFIYLPCRHHLKHSNVRSMLRTLKISQARILDVQFPARGIVALLVYKQFREDLNQQLFKEGIKPILNFNPLDPK
ncbi:hypothetical protein DFQ28_004172, partial [Apophysomyces sp. BC1034]